MLDEIINGDLMTMTLSGARTSSGPSKVKIRPVMVKDQMKFQASEYVDTKVLHTNNDPNVMEEKILGWMEKDFKQLQAQTRKLDVTVLVSKKGKVTIKKKTKTQDMLKTRDKEGAADLKTPQKADGDRDPFSLVAAHNREKRYILKEGSPVDFLVDLGVMTKDGKVCAPDMTSSVRSTGSWNLFRIFFLLWIRGERCILLILAAESPILPLPCIIILNPSWL